MTSILPSSLFGRGSNTVLVVHMVEITLGVSLLFTDLSLGDARADFAGTKKFLAFQRIVKVFSALSGSSAMFLKGKM